MPRIQEALDSKSLPHFTTVQKASARLETTIWRVLQRVSALLVEGDGVATLDAPGWGRSHANCHYTRKVKLRSLKVTSLVDTGAQSVLNLHITAIHKHYTRIVSGSVGRNPDRFDMPSAYKDYDDGGLRKWLWSWGKRPLIRHRGFAPHDKATNARMNPELYRRCSLMETVVSVTKRKLGLLYGASVVPTIPGASGDVFGLQLGAGGESKGELPFVRLPSLLPGFFNRGSLQSRL